MILGDLGADVGAHRTTEHGRQTAGTDYLLRSRRSVTADPSRRRAATWC